MSVSDALTPVWTFLNQKTGNFFRDFKEERELEKDAGVCRDITRLLCLLCLVGGFGYVFCRLFKDAPNIEVNRVYLEKENSNYAIQHQYNSLASYGTDIDAAKIASAASVEQDVLDCPCTNTSISWTTYVHFYTIKYTSPDQRVIRYNMSRDQVIGMEYNKTNLNMSHFSRKTFNCKTICPVLTVLPNAVLKRSSNVLTVYCPAMLSALLTTEPQPNNGRNGSNWVDPKGSYYESPSLETQKLLYSDTIHRLLAYMREQYTLQSTVLQPFNHGDDATFGEMTLKGITDLWLFALERFGANSSSTDFDFFTSAASRTQTGFPFQTSVVILEDGQAFLGMNISWLEYYNACSPAYCDVTKRSTAFRRISRVLAQIGGLWNFAFVGATLVIWPVVATLLGWISKCCKRWISAWCHKCWIIKCIFPCRYITASSHEEENSGGEGGLPLVVLKGNYSI